MNRRRNLRLVENPVKIKLKIVAYFSTSKSDRQSTSFYHAFHHELTTKAPRLHAVFRKNPLKNLVSPHQKNSGSIALKNVLVPSQT
jgi:hypothetical protein